MTTDLDMLVENTVWEVLTGQYHHCEANLRGNIKAIQSAARAKAMKEAAAIVKEPMEKVPDPTMQKYTLLLQHALSQAILEKI